MRKTHRLLLMMAVALAVLFSGCSQEASGLREGYYTAEAASFDAHGWKEYLTIYVSDNKILTVEYDAYNTSGFVRSWDVNYMRTMNRIAGTYPNEFTRTYAVSLLNWQDPDGVDAVTGATISLLSFQKLTEAALTQARTGDKQVALVELSESLR